MDISLSLSLSDVNGEEAVSPREIGHPYDFKVLCIKNRNSITSL